MQFSKAKLYILIDNITMLFNTVKDSDYEMALNHIGKLYGIGIMLRDVLDEQELAKDILTYASKLRKSI